MPWVQSRLWSTLDWQQRGEVLTARDETERGILIFRTCLMLAVCARAIPAVPH